jgi:hypothetical protein
MRIRYACNNAGRQFNICNFAALKFGEQKRSSRREAGCFCD